MASHEPPHARASRRRSWCAAAGAARDVPVAMHETQFRAVASVHNAILALTRHWIMLYFDVYDCQNIFRSDLDDDARCNDINNVAMRTDSQVTIMLL